MQDAHAMAIRALETRLTVVETANNASRTAWRDVWVGSIAVLSLFLSGINAATFLIWHPK